MGTEREREGNESNGGDGNGDEDGNGNENGNGIGNGNGDRIGQGGTETKKCKKAHKTCRRHVGNGGDSDDMSKKCRKEKVGPVASNPDNLENSKEGGGGHKVPKA